ncbi:hypothetical protein V6582_17785 [Agrobacterium vitis]|uniref:hypothetical protein n=1 Tax=Agrobacterium vitis TaxID=373 RepID=UPI0012E700F8|nr:hypothetical protein [Agrobacterium vitis]MVA23183.1 hypothetical protein [Agrobacterium vitis]
MNDNRYYARSASDRTDEWPFWFVADQRHGVLNVTGRLFEKLTGQPANGAVFTDREYAETLATQANNTLHEGESK